MDIRRFRFLGQRNQNEGHAEFYFSTPQDIHACLVCDMQVADFSIAYLYDGVPKQVRHDLAVYIKHQLFQHPSS